MLHLRMRNNEFTPDGLTPVGHAFGDGDPLGVTGLHLVPIHEPVQVVLGVGVAGGVTSQHQSLIFLHIRST